MIRIEVDLPEEDEDPFDPQGASRAIGAGMGKLGTEYPAYELWQIESKAGPSRYNLIRPNGEKLRSRLAIGRGSNRLQNGQIVQVIYYKRDRRQAYILCGMGFAEWQDTKLGPLLGLWVCPEGLPWLPHSAAGTEPQIKLSTAGDPGFTMFLDRSEGGGFLLAGRDSLGLLLFSMGPAAAPIDTILAVMYPVYPTYSDLNSTHVLIHEKALGGTALGPITVPINSTRSGSDNSDRWRGYFFVHQVSEIDVVYVVAFESGIRALRRSAPLEVVSSEWVGDETKDHHSGNVAAAEEFLLECSYSGLKIESDTIVPGGTKVQAYVRNEALAYQPLPALDLSALWPSLTGSVAGYRYTWKQIFEVANQGASPSSRWPYLRTDKRQEWWLWVNGRNNPTPRFLVLAMNAATAAASTVLDWSPDYAWKFLYPGLVTSETARLTEEAAESQAGEGIPITNPYYTIKTTVGYNVPADPIGEPPHDEEHEEELTLDVGGLLNGTQYTGNILQSPGSFKAATAVDDEDRFFTAPLGSQQPTGVLNAANTQYYTVVYEPQRYVYGLVAVDNIPQVGDDPHYENEDRWLYFGEQTYFETNGYYLWWLTRIQGGDGGQKESLFFNPTLYMTTDPVNDPRGNYNPCYPGTPCFTPLGDALLGPVTNISRRNYSLKQHGEYAWEMRHRTWLLVCDTATNRLKFKQDISRYYVDGPLNGFASRVATPQKLNVYSWLPAGANYIWVLREDYFDTTPNEDGDQTTGGKDVVLDLYRVNSSSLTLLGTLNLHPAFDVPDRSATFQGTPYMMVGVNSDGKPYAHIWSEWDLSGTKVATSEVLWNGSALALTGETWDGHDIPRPAVATNSVHHNGKLYWPFGIILFEK